MQNFIKTIINAVQSWTKKEIKNSTADWSQNDSSASNYVKNRTHWEENGVVHKIDEKYLPELTSTPDWNQNNPEAKDYIKNRPFYEEVEYITHIEEQTVTFSAQSTWCEASVPNVNMPWDLVPYKVTFDGVEYEGTMFDNADNAWIPVTLSDGTSMLVYNWGFIYINSTDYAGDHTIKVEQKAITVHTIDSKYLGVPIYSGEGDNSICINNSENIASGEASHAEGSGTKAFGEASHAEGTGAIASKLSQHVSGEYNIAEDGPYIQTETTTTSYSQIGLIARVYYSQTYSFDKETNKYTLTGDVGVNPSSSIYNTTTYYYIYGSATGSTMYYGCKKGYSYNSHLRLYSGTIIFGVKYTAGQRGKYVSVVGNGTSNVNRSNAHTLDWNGVGWFQGGLQVGGNAQDDGAKNVLLEGDAIPAPTTAQVGQFLSVKAVDENGKPTEWETIEISNIEGSNGIGIKSIRIEEVI